MLKKMEILGVIGFVAVTALGGTKLASYIRSEIAAARERAEANVPPEKEIARLRNEVKLLDNDIMTVVNQLAKERVEVKELQAKVEELAARQSKDKELLTARANAIKNAEGHVTFGTRTLSIDAAKSELEGDVKRFSTNQKSLESMDATLAVRIKNRDMLEKQLETMKNQKTELTVAIDALETELTALKLQQMESKYQTDDTRLAKIKESIAKQKKRLDVQRRELNLLQDTVAPSLSTSNESVDDIMAPVKGKKPAITKSGD